MSWGLNDKIHIKCLEQGLICYRDSVRASWSFTKGSEISWHRLACNGFDLQNSLQRAQGPKISPFACFHASLTSVVIHDPSKMAQTSGFVLSLVPGCRFSDSREWNTSGGKVLDSAPLTTFVPHLPAKDMSKHTQEWSENSMKRKYSFRIERRCENMLKLSLLLQLMFLEKIGKNINIVF